MPTDPNLLRPRPPRRLSRDLQLYQAISAFIDQRLDAVDRKRPLGSADLGEVNRLLAFARGPMARARRDEVTEPFRGRVMPGDAFVALSKVRVALERDYLRPPAPETCDESVATPPA